MLLTLKFIDRRKKMYQLSQGQSLRFFRCIELQVTVVIETLESSRLKTSTRYLHSKKYICHGILGKVLVLGSSGLDEDYVSSMSRLMEAI